MGRRLGDDFNTPDQITSEQARPGRLCGDLGRLPRAGAHHARCFKFKLIVDLTTRIRPGLVPASQSFGKLNESCDVSDAASSTVLTSIRLAT